MSERDELLEKMPLPRWYGIDNAHGPGLRGFVLDALLALDVLPKKGGEELSHQELEIISLKRRIIILEAAMRQFADPHNWYHGTGSLQWAGKRSAIEYAEEVLRGR